MNKEIIDKWLENEYGVSYTRLEKLHDFVIEQDLKHQEQKDKQIDQLTNNWNELEEWLKELQKLYEENEFQNNAKFCITVDQVLDKMKEIKDNDKFGT